MPKVKQHKARTDIYNQGVRIPDEKTKTGYRRDRSKPADEKDTIFVQKGETYYAWGMMVGGRGVQRTSKTPPTRSMLTNSEFLGAIYDLEDNLDTSGTTPEELQSARDELVSALRDLGEEQQGKYDNMPDGLQQGDTGQLLEGRAQSCEGIADEFDNVDLEYDEPDEDELREAAKEDLNFQEDDHTEDDIAAVEAKVEALKQENLDEWLEEKRGELTDVSWDYE
jgi:hypothetical protein